MSIRCCAWSLCATSRLLLFGKSAVAQVPTPASVLGHTPGDDYYLANHEEAVNYFHVLASHTNWMKMYTVAKSTQGRDIEVGVISAPERLAHLDEYKGMQNASARADLERWACTRPGSRCEGDCPDRRRPSLLRDSWWATLDCACVQICFNTERS